MHLQGEFPTLLPMVRRFKRVQCLDLSECKTLTNSQLTAYTDQHELQRIHNLSV